jgi:hypothetical protein
MRGTRRQSLAVGLLVCLPVLLLGVLPALAWKLTDGRLPGEPTSDRRSGSLAPRVSQGASVRVTGSPRTVLSPGIASPIELHFLNPQGRPVTVRRVEIRITGLDARRADAAHPCSPSDFRIRQMPNRTLVLPSRQATDLTELGVPLRSWPRLKLRNRPGNQDGCKGAHLTLGYRAYGGPS